MESLKIVYRLHNSANQSGLKYLEIVMTFIILLFFTITNTTDQTEKIYKDIRLWKKDLRKVKK